MSTAPEIRGLTPAGLAAPVRAFLGRPDAEILTWEHRPIRYINTETANLGLHRFIGTARVEGEVQGWSVVLKAVRAPVNTEDPSHWNYHRREVLAYQDGLLTSLPGGLCAPRCLGLELYEGDVVWLWLEDIAEAVGTAWSLADYGVAARQLGLFNGAYLAGHPLPHRSWLSRQWVRGWLAEYDRGCQRTVNLMDQPAFWEHPWLAAAFPHPIAADVKRMWSSHPQLLSTLDALPQTFCHMDAYRPNLILRQNAPDGLQAVALDWVFAGTGAVGEEIANLLAASLTWCEFDAAQVRQLDEAIYSNYLEGLRAAGWQGDPRLARLGYTAACALRWGVIGLWWLLSIGNVAEEADFERDWGRPMPELVHQWARTAYHVLDLAEEAYQLRRAIS